MFAADLSWTEPDTEKVGQRRERIAKERSSPSAAPSIKSSRSSKTSVTSVADDKELWWTSSLRKAKSIKPNKKGRPGTSRSTGTEHSRKASSSIPRTLEIELPHELRDPTLQPAWTYSSTLSPTLPSGAPLDPPEYEVPELEGDLSSRGTNSTGSRSSHERQWSVKSPGKVKVIDEVHEVQQLSPRSFIARTTRMSSEAAEPEDIVPVSAPSEKRKKRAYSVKIEGGLDFEALKLQDQPDDVTALPSIDKQPSYASGLPDSNIVAWRPPPEWNIVLPGGLRHDKRLPPTPGDEEKEVAVARDSPIELTRFQRFIRRMESAGPKIILDRMKEEWHDPVDAEADEELILEKQLWVLTAFQLQNLGQSRTAPRPQCNTGKILELYGNLGKSFPGIVPFPWPDFSFSHIRASTLPSLVPSAKLPQVLRECYRLLAPGGLLEIRIMDAAPVRKSAGPKMRAWIEDRVSLNLERRFRCSKPCMLVPGWLAEAGFELPAASEKRQAMMRLPCAFDTNSSDVDAELSMQVGRALWKDIWGQFVDDDPDEPRWWWEDAEVAQECLERRTVFECGAIFAYKP
ncbi:hypothetical protein BU26DRAFT_471096 [Trematosphaeria pertusa]|uniref:Methyltransferase type 11 domain-containing protein n=1 Tax=Trematosphaeria pertusa TaxID=390896 RepID=A0A6A6IZN0_9PLEO|nr:uncharacterized protein BU26DRAFT_471096 [Trematosphaeria pertusa]KAF2255517.1 hypothetical protein BU26DRAFT_471096 [Trematosphaeria pertusa]